MTLPAFPHTSQCTSSHCVYNALTVKEMSDTVIAFVFLLGYNQKSRHKKTKNSEDHLFYVQESNAQCYDKKAARVFQMTIFGGFQMTIFGVFQMTIFGIFQMTIFVCIL